MTNILSTSQIVQRYLDFYKVAQPDLDTKPGTVSRDLLVDGIAVRMAELYNELLMVSASQSISKSVGTDLTNLGSNYAVSKLTPGTASGPALLTFNALSSDITIGGGAFIYARNGVAYRIISGTVISAANESQYRALATTYRNDLDFVGITDNYAIEVVVEAATTGTQGNISKYALTSASIPNISGVTNVVPFTGGTSGENDAAYRTRVLSVFSGSNTGTDLGYKNIVLSDPSVLDAIVVGPGDPLMTRDNSIQQTDENGNLVLTSDGDPIIISEGTGGKVDVYVYGRRSAENLDSFIYTDKSSRADPTSSVNDYTIGQLSGDSNKTVTRRRLENIAARSLPAQPVLNILEVTGSRSGLFSQQILDEYGNSIGNYQLLKDPGVYAGTCFGFDKLHWVSNYISTIEDVTKNVFNGQDSILYSDVTDIPSITRIVNVINENSAVTSDKSQLQLGHTPIKSINKVLNATTGERYIVSNRNPNGNTQDLNTSGLITISGKNLPSASDTLQVDYEWNYSHDPYIDYDSFRLKNNPRTSVDIIDWGYSNAISREEQIIDDGYTVVVEHNISSVVSINKIEQQAAVVSISTDGVNYIIDNLLNVVSSVVSVKRSDGAELYNTNEYDGTFDGKRIILPTDTAAQSGDAVTVTYNAFDLYNIGGSVGTFTGNVITLIPAVKDYITLYSTVECNYISNVNEILPSTNLSNLPAAKYFNKFTLNGTGTTTYGVQPFTNVYSGSTIIKNLRKSPTRLNINLSGITNPGLIQITGETVLLGSDIILNSISSGLTLDLSLFIKELLGIDFTQTLSASNRLIKLISVEKVEASNDVVTNVITDYDIIGYSIKDNSYDLDTTVKNTSLSNTQVVLPTTIKNIADPPKVGDKLRVTFYIVKDSDYENISFSTNGSLYSDKLFAYVDTIAVSSGFKSGSTLVGTMTIAAMNQPSSGSRYRARYNYTAPKNGERITVRYNTNALIGDLTLSIEDSRALTADVMIKSDSSILIDVIAQIKVLPTFYQTRFIIGQNVGDKLASYINALQLGSTLHPSDLVSVAYQVTGLDSIVITRFNKFDKTGMASSIVALKNQHMQANIVTINLT